MPLLQLWDLHEQTVVTANVTYGEIVMSINRKKHNKRK